MLKGDLDEPSRRQLRTYVEAMRRFIAETEFIDVAQGITIREDGCVRLKQERTPA